MSALNFSIEDRENVKIVHLSGPISSLTRADFEILVEDLLLKANVILNLARVNLITVSGLTSMVDVSVSARKKGKRVLVLGMKPELMKTADTLDIYDHFIFIETIEEGQLKLKYYT
ncbi:MAG: STAS domain-containing protein [Spirochaetes bacterium]|nr:MAG: STAS domain-containing protein [Spirochaetota bacterium]